MKKPNIIFIMTDEHDPGVTGCYGNEIVNTPNIDRMAKEGITFDACYTNSPLCVPARLSFTAGKYISRVAAWNNSSMLPSDDIPSLPGILNDAGYDTILVGKMHYDRKRRYGFKHDVIPQFNSNRKVSIARRRDASDITPNVGNWQRRSSSFHPGDNSRILSHDRKITKESIDIIKQRNEDDPPMFMLVGYLAPHFPLTVPKEYYAKYKDRVPMPDIPEGLIENLPLNYQHLRYGFGVVDTDPEVVKRGRECYYALTEWMDNEVGKVLDALEKSGIADNTIVVFTTDHGENKGDHGLWWKNNMYDHASKVPLVIWWPGVVKAGERRTGVCSLVDVVKTVAEIAGASIPEDWDGDSMLWYIKDGSEEWKDFALSEYYGHNIASGMTMVRKGAWKYIYHNKIMGETGGNCELFNLKEDPREFENLARDEKFQDKVKEMHTLMVSELGEEPDDVEKRFMKLAKSMKSKIAKFAIKRLGGVLKKFKKGKTKKK